MALSTDCLTFSLTGVWLEGMLIYLVSATRRYGISPCEPDMRGRWEFQAVVRGAIGMTIPGRESRLQGRRLWLSAPRHVHGWTGDGKNPAEVVVFHFPAVPEPLRMLVGDDEAIDIPLSDRDCRRLRELADRAGPYWRHPAPGMVMCHEHALLELSLLVHEALRGKAAGLVADNDRRVGEALRWYAEHMAENPGQAEVARAVNVSASHLRRLFHEVLQAAPKTTFDQLRFQRAVQMMADPGVKLCAVGEACGFGSPSAFSRAFKAKFGCAPDVWRG